MTQIPTHINTFSTTQFINIENPATNEVIGKIPAFTKDDVDAAAEKAALAFTAWEKAAATTRAIVLMDAARKIRERQDILAALLTREQGKPFAEAKNEIQGAAHVFEYYASICGSIHHGDARHLPNYGYLNVVRRPVGLCAAIIPWNMPAIIFAWKIGAALACGNAILAKPSATASLTILSMADAMHEALAKAKVNADILQIVTGTGATTGKILLEHDAIRHISFTGSIATGKSVAEIAARNLKKTTLELGGNDAFIVTDTADIKQAATAAVRHRFYNCGQVCTSAKRILVHESCADEFIKLASERINKIIVGDGMNGATMGPLNNKEQLETVDAAVKKIIDSGKGELVMGGVRGIEGARRVEGAHEVERSSETRQRGENKMDENRMDGNRMDENRMDENNIGYFYSPTLIKDVEPLAVVDEIFGPVMAVMTFADDDEALSIANGTQYGLGASVWTKQIKTANKYADELKSGVVWVNKHLILPPEMPFGGVAASGFGRENGLDFISEYTESKSVLFG